ncbi:hypothetical protein [Candidatus Palauibacter sp.]|uniref:hypothetical protein n=1 Tax=Candidatus Palauibacter sp. TaxID=3101350 RepID=UPI003AF1F70A
MSEASARRIKVTVRAVQILESLDVDKTGEFVFRSRVSSHNLDGSPREGRYPAEGHMKISEDPVYNRVILNWEIFQGEVTDHLVIELTGEEEDRFSGNDFLTSYQREFRGPVAEWLGTYGPGKDTGAAHDDDPEMMSDWRVTLFIDPA